MSVCTPTIARRRGSNPTAPSDSKYQSGKNDSSDGLEEAASNAGSTCVMKPRFLRPIQADSSRVHAPSADRAQQSGSECVEHASAEDSTANETTRDSRNSETISSSSSAPLVKPLEPLLIPRAPTSQSGGGRSNPTKGVNILCASGESAGTDGLLAACQRLERARHGLAEERRKLYRERRLWCSESEAIQRSQGCADAESGERSGSPVDPGSILTVPEKRAAFCIGEPVTWLAHDGDIGPGQLGCIMDLKADGRVSVRFQNGTWCFCPEELRKQSDDIMKLLAQVQEPSRPRPAARRGIGGG